MLAFPAPLAGFRSCAAFSTTHMSRIFHNSSIHLLAIVDRQSESACSWHGMHFAAQQAMAKQVYLGRSKKAKTKGHLFEMSFLY
jgi:hypothetical protein